MELREYILDQRILYKDTFNPSIQLRQTLLEEYPLFKDEIDKSLKEYIHQGIMFDVSKNLAIDSEMIYNVLEDMNLFQLLDIIP